MNSLYDPDSTAVGNKRGLGFGTLATIYDQYRVNACKVQLTVINTTARSLIVALVAGNDTANMIYSSADEVIVAPGAKHIILNPTATSRPKALKGYAKIHSVMGITKAQYNTDVEYSADVTADPTSEAFFGISIIDPSTTAGPTATVFVELTHYCNFTHRKQLSLTAAP